MHLIKDENGNLVQHGHEHTHEHTHADGVSHTHAHTHEGSEGHDHTHTDEQNCGTGCGSTACVLWKMGLLPENKLTAQVPGGTLRVWVEGGEQVTRLLLEGPTEITEVLEG